MAKILYSPGYGAGWTSWNERKLWSKMFTWQPLIEAVERGEKIQDDHPAVLSLVEEIEREFGEDTYVCTLGSDQLQVAEVFKAFYIEEYDGSESIVTPNDFIALEELGCG